jgi:hypothetical protein
VPTFNCGRTYFTAALAYFAPFTVQRLAPNSDHPNSASTPAAHASITNPSHKQGESQHAKNMENIWRRTNHSVAMGHESITTPSPPHPMMHQMNVNIANVTLANTIGGTRSATANDRLIANPMNGRTKKKTTYNNVNG